MTGTQKNLYPGINEFEVSFGKEKDGTS